jgi:hypothetical protein
MRHREYVSGVADKTPAAPNITSLKRHVMRPFAVEITAGDSAFAASHCAISFVTAP